MTYPDNGVAADLLQSFIDRVERMNEEKAALNADISEIYKEAKGQGFDTRVIKRIVADRAKDSNELAEFATLYELYCEAIGMVPATRASTRD